LRRTCTPQVDTYYILDIRYAQKRNKFVLRLHDCKKGIYFNNHNLEQITLNINETMSSDITLAKQYTRNG